MRNLLPQLEVLDAAEAAGAAQTGRRSTKKSVAEAARESLASLTKAVFEECAAESDPAALQQQESNAQAAVSDLLTQSAGPQRQSQLSVAGIPVAQAEAELARSGAEEVAVQLRRDTVRLIEAIEKRASGAAPAASEQDLAAIADRIASSLAGEAAASGDAPGLYMAALTQRVMPQLKAVEELEARLSASVGRRSSRKSLTAEARESLVRVSDRVFSALAKEGGDAVDLEQQQTDMAKLVDRAIADGAAEA